MKALCDCGKSAVVLQALLWGLTAVTATAQRRLELLLSGKWPTSRRGNALDVPVAGQHAYSARKSSVLVVSALKSWSLVRPI
jgi:hypothetical protein